MTRTLTILDIPAGELTFEQVNAWGSGCKCCDQPTTGTWWMTAGDIYAEDCAIRMDKELGNLAWRRIPTRAQLDDSRADIGRN